ncbi:hypothetical protein BHW_0900063 (plasmid) [Borrelia hermsii MTW]|uniref:Uncharacterized protein n=1 Tax=Borrelia hermsii MTW TaxID=1313291 RepID=W5T6I2_BORHE|nr:hypothetical protein BHW_0900063 [Borrelia hermsii MTW]
MAKEGKFSNDAVAKKAASGLLVEH